MTKQELINHLKVHHGYRDEDADPTPEAARAEGGTGIVVLDHPIWTERSLEMLHADDHTSYPDTGTPVKGWAHRHKATVQ